MCSCPFSGGSFAGLFQPWQESHRTGDDGFALAFERSAPRLFEWQELQQPFQSPSERGVAQPCDGALERGLKGVAFPDVGLYGLRQEPPSGGEDVSASGGENMILTLQRGEQTRVQAKVVRNEQRGRGVFESDFRCRIREKCKDGDARSRGLEPVRHEAQERVESTGDREHPVHGLRARHRVELLLARVYLLCARVRGDEQGRVVFLGAA